MKMAANILSFFGKVERFITLTAFAVMTLVIIADVVSRKVTGVGIAGAPRIAVFAMIATAFVSVGLASDARRHLRPKFSDRWLPVEWDGTITVIQELLTAIFCLILAVVAVSVVQETYELQEQTRMLRIPVWPMQALIPLVFFIATIRHAIFGLVPSLRPTLEEGASLDGMPEELPDSPADKTFGEEKH